MSTSILLTEQRDGLLLLTLNRPEKRNALSLELLRELDAALTSVEQNQQVRVVAIMANGRAFCAGHDLGEMVGRTEADYQELFETCSRVMLKLQQIPQPTIACVHAMATAAGCQLVAACDLAIAAREARFATPGVKIGLFCTTPMVPLVRTIPAKAAMEMLLTGQPITADRAYELGLLSRVVPAEDLNSTLEQYVASIKASSPHTVGIGKHAFYSQYALPQEAAYIAATSTMVENSLTHDAQEGMQAFLEKRPPQWTGR